MILRPAREEDVAFIRAIVQRPENAAFLTDENDDQLAAYLTDPAARMLIWQDDFPRGFALFVGIGDPSGTINLLRLGLDLPGHGEGAAFIQSLIDHAFGPLEARRLWLDVAGENLRAQRAYARAGFTHEGVLRQHEWRPAVGRVVDVALYGMLRHEWSALPRPT